jgi:hypothetical protein
MTIKNASVLPTFTDVPQATYTVELAGTKYNLRLTWRPRLASWYMDVFDVDDVPIALGYRVTPESVWRKLIPDGFFLAVGPDPYLREHLGQTLLPMYVEVE